jgi:serine/threonine protein phosphatase PrpC
MDDDFQCEEKSLGLIALASGGDDGWLVSRTAIRALRQYVAETDHGGDGPAPTEAIRTMSAHANRLRAAVLAAWRSVEGACTAPLQMAAVLVGDRSAAVSMSGDCRVYLARAGRLRPLEVRAVPPDAGTTPVVGVREIDTDPEDRWLICSGDLAAALGDTDIADVVLDMRTPVSQLGPRLIDLAAIRLARRAAALVISPAEALRSASHVATQWI